MGGRGANFFRGRCLFKCTHRAGIKCIFKMTSENENVKEIRYFKCAWGDNGKVFKAVKLDDPEGTLPVFKFPVTEKEVQMATEWAARNRGKKENYSAGPVKKVFFKYIVDDKKNYDFEFFDASGRPVNGTEKPKFKARAITLGLEMTDLGIDTYEDFSHKFTPGENVLLYLMLVHCTLRLAGMEIHDTAWHNCMCQGRGEDLKIYLVDTAEWGRSLDESHMMENFAVIVKEFHLLENKDLQPIYAFLKIDFTLELPFLDAMQASCVKISEHFLCNPDTLTESVHYHERIDSLLAAITAETALARRRLQAFQERDLAYHKAKQQLRRTGRLHTPFAADL